MKKQTPPPVCPWGTTFEEAMWGRKGRKPRTEEAQRKQINAMLDTMQQAGDFWTLELLRRLLILLTRFDDHAFTVGIVISHLTMAAERQAKEILYWSKQVLFH